MMDKIYSRHPLSDLINRGWCSHQEGNTKNHSRLHVQRKEGCRLILSYQVSFRQYFITTIAGRTAEKIN